MQYPVDLLRDVIGELERGSEGFKNLGSRDLLKERGKGLELGELVKGRYV